MKSVNQLATSKRLLEAVERKPLRMDAAPTLPSFDDLPNSALVRQAQLVRDPKHPTRPTPLPFSPATFWRKVKEGQFPQPIKLGKHITAWKVAEVRAWMDGQAYDSLRPSTSPVKQIGGAQ